MTEGRRRWLLLMGIVLSVVVVFSFFTTVTGRGVKQPIQFNHKAHKEQGLECMACHQYVRERTFAGVPKIEVCMECHEQPVTENPEEDKIRQFSKANHEIQWGRLYQMPNHVFFTHRVHVVIDEIPCNTCHGDIGDTVKPPSRSLKTMSMNDCMDCHRETGANNDCLACHN